MNGPVGNVDLRIRAAERELDYLRQLQELQQTNTDARCAVIEALGEATDRRLDRVAALLERFLEIILREKRECLPPLAESQQAHHPPAHS